MFLVENSNSMIFGLGWIKTTRSGKTERVQPIPSVSPRGLKTGAINLQEGLFIVFRLP